MIEIDLPRVPLAFLPTPLEELGRLTKVLGGPRLFVKRDDQTGLATGGNKARKLEFLVADALDKGADLLITAGGLQSNHTRQTAAAAARYGLNSHLVLSGEAPADWHGNLLLDRMLGASFSWAGEKDLYGLEEAMAQVAEARRAEGWKPYVIPVGGSNAVGATGYVLAMLELGEQLAAQSLEIERIVVASGSAGTQAGLAVGARAIGFEGQIVGISIAAGQDILLPMLAALAGETAALLGLDYAFSPADFTLYDDYLGGGYGVMGRAEREAIELLARVEGILADPVYTGRALAGLIDLIRRGVFKAGENVLFWHTGGTPALFAPQYAELL
jgi:D-cysteine desulfhydrase family pyridoxal phosphate-dependent enzyme